MTPEIELTNHPMEFSLGGKTVQLRRASIAEREAAVHSVVIGRAIATAREVAAALYPDDEAKRTEYFLTEVSRTTTGKILGEAIDAAGYNHATICRLVAAAAVPPMTPDEVDMLFAAATVDDVTVAVRWVVGLGKKKQATSEVGAPSAPDSASTDTPRQTSPG